MLEYYVSVYRRYHKFPSQILLYVGEEPMRMQAELSEPGHSFHFRYKLVDIRELDGDQRARDIDVGQAALRRELQ